MVTMPSQRPLSGGTYVDALLWGGWHWADTAAAPGAPVVINYFLDTYAGRSWTAAEGAALTRALKTWSDVANITFVQTGSAASAHLVERLGSDARLPGILGQHGTPDSAANGPEYDGPILLGDGVRGYGYYNYSYFTPGGFGSGGYDFVTLVHELGHGLGLAHPHDDGGGSGLFPGVRSGRDEDLGSNNLNQGIYTVMSYNDGWASSQNPGGRGLTKYGFSAGPMAFDIAAIQYLYGANTTSHSGSDVYRLPSANKAGTGWVCLWDTGGIDTIVHSSKINVRIDLRAATLDNSSLGGGALSYAKGIYGGFTIASGVVIENARGGSGNDVITGNSAANVLSGGAGNDQLRGGGNDTFSGGSGIDTVSYAAAASFVAVDLYTGTGTAGASAGDVFAFASAGRSNVENLFGSAYDDWLTGDSNANKISGGTGDDVIEGRGGSDRLAGGGHSAQGDTVSYEHASRAVKVTLSSTREQDTRGAGRDTLSGFENLTGSAFSDQLTGSNGANKLNGGGGNDRLTGGGGSDVFLFNSATGPSNIDTITDFRAGIDYLHIDDAIFAGVGSNGALGFGLFALGTFASEADDRFVYHQATGRLHYDVDGSGASAAIVFVVLSTKPSLSAADIFIV